MSADLLRSTQAKAPKGDGVGTNPSGVLRYTSGAALSSAVPRTEVNEWRGAEVEIKNESTTAGEFVFVLFSVGAAVTLVVTAAAADGGPLQTRGEFLAPGERIRRKIPGSPTLTQDVFFNRIAGAGTPSISVARISG